MNTPFVRKTLGCVRSMFTRKITPAHLFALSGWMIWPLVLSGLFAVYRVTSELGIRSWARCAGMLQARVWFQEGHQRLLELSPDQNRGFTGRRDGPFEIWTWTDHTQSSWFMASSGNQEFVEAFNQRMRQLWDQKRQERE